MKSLRKYPYYVICLDESGYEGSLIRPKIYRVVKPKVGDRASDLRVIDEEGEDYLYPAKRFDEVQITPRVLTALNRDFAAAG